MKGIERLRGMLGGSFQKPLLKIFMYLKNREDMDEKFLNPEKSLKQMYEYIKYEAEKQAVEGVAILDDAVVYSLAVHYFDESNEILGLNKINNDKKKQTTSIMTSKKENEQEQEQKDREQISLFKGGAA